jgi:alpha-mannosidase
VGGEEEGDPPLSQLTHSAFVCLPPPLPSRADVGWDESLDEYRLGTGPIAGRNVTLIVEQVVTALAMDPRRTFQAVEMAFWLVIYEQFPPDLQALFVRAVQSKQLTFLNAGWSMHDEANPSYVDMLDNTHVSHSLVVGIP